MKPVFILIISFFFVLLTFHSEVHAEELSIESIQDNSTQEIFPKEISFDYEGKHYDLIATGVATRKKLFFKVYSIAHYLQKNAVPENGSKLQKIMSDNNAKQLTMKWVRDVDNEKMKETLLDSFRNVLPRKICPD